MCHAGSQYLDDALDVCPVSTRVWSGRASGLGHFQETWHQGLFSPRFSPPSIHVGEFISSFRCSFFGGLFFRLQIRSFELLVSSANKVLIVCSFEAEITIFGDWISRARIIPIFGIMMQGNITPDDPPPGNPSSMPGWNSQWSLEHQQL